MLLLSSNINERKLVCGEVYLTALSATKASDNGMTDE
jgi:hypothetical protein